MRQRPPTLKPGKMEARQTGTRGGAYSPIRVECQSEAEE